ncbi:MAG: hypothetical protein ACFFA3_18530 [Promethearchaeota archaeon]
MKIPIYILKTQYKYVLLKKIMLECTGTGTEDNPAIIEPSGNLPQSFRILNSNIYIDIVHCQIKSLLLANCQNIRVLNCTINYNIIEHCTKIEFKNVVANRKLQLFFCENIKIEECTIEKLKLNHSNSNIFKKSTINQLKKIRCKDNIFEANLVPEKLSLKLDESSRLRDLNDKLKLNILVPALIISSLVFLVILPLVTNSGLELSFFIIFLIILIPSLYLPEVAISIKKKKQKSIQNDGTSNL